MSKVLILSGGGSRAAFQAGAYETLIQEGWEPDAVAGISAGALNGAMIATGQWDSMIRTWENISEDQVLRRRRKTRSAKRFLLHKLGVHTPNLGLYDNKPLDKLLRRNIGGKFHMTYYCGTVDIENGRYFEHKALPMQVPWNLINAIVASTAIPVIFDPVEVSGRLHVDGGVRHMNPLGQILSELNPTDIRIITCNKYRDINPQEEGRPKNIVDVGKRSLSILLDEIFMKDLREFERINRLVRQAQAQGATLTNKNGQPYKEYTAKLYQPSQSLGDSLNFGKEQARKNLEHGRMVKPIKL